jgi:hypothetical protein
MTTATRARPVCAPHSSTTSPRSGIGSTHRHAPRSSPSPEPRPTARAIAVDAIEDLTVSIGELGLVVTGIELGLGVAPPAAPTTGCPLHRLGELEALHGAERVRVALARTIAEIAARRGGGL